MDYSQPKFYRFTSDSLELAKSVIHHLETRATQIDSIPLKVLELGAGCGVISCEIANASGVCLEMNLCEIQDEFLEYLNHNITLVKPTHSKTTLQVLANSWEKLEAKSFDLILSNPPFFLAGHGLTGSDPRRERARRWSLAQRDRFYEVILEKLGHSGVVALVLRESPPQSFLRHFRVLEERIINPRSENLTRIIVLALNIETDKALF